jgi:ATP-dependent DNA ligase
MLSPEDEGGWGSFETVDRVATFARSTESRQQMLSEQSNIVHDIDHRWSFGLDPHEAAEIAFDGVQSSSRYPGRVGLRFARVVRYRNDISAAEADTIDMVRQFLADRG